MDTNIRGNTIAKVIIALAMLGLFLWGLSIGDAGALTFTSPPNGGPGSHLPPRPTLEHSCATHKCADDPAPTGTPFVSPLRAPARVVSAPTPIQWRSHSPAWPGDFRRTRR